MNLIRKWLRNRQTIYTGHYSSGDPTTVDFMQPETDRKTGEPIRYTMVECHGGYALEFYPNIPPEIYERRYELTFDEMVAISKRNTPKRKTEPDENTISPIPPGYGETSLLLDAGLSFNRWHRLMADDE